MSSSSAMGSSASSIKSAAAAPASNLSSPEIKVTDDHGNGTVIHLPESMAEQRTRALTDEAREAEKKIELATRPGTKRSASSEAALLKQSAPTSNPAEPPINARGKSKELQRVSSAHGSLRMSLKSMTSSSLLSSSKKKQSLETARCSSSVATSGTSSPTPTDTPEVKTIFAKRTCPDLDAVSAALESLKTQGSREPEDPLILNLQSLERKIQGAREDSSKLLVRAMQARDRQQHEVCRALCIQIVHAQHSRLETKVYAYNILSTQASPGQAMNFLREAAELVKLCEGPEKEKLAGVVAMLQENVMSKEKSREAGRCTNGNHAGEGGAVQQVLDLESFERVPTMPKKAGREEGGSENGNGSGSGSGVLQLPKEKVAKGTLTPKSEKIFNWALPGSKGKMAAAAV